MPLSEATSNQRVNGQILTALLHSEISIDLNGYLFRWWMNFASMTVQEGTAYTTGEAAGRGPSGARGAGPTAAEDQTPSKSSRSVLCVVHYSFRETLYY